MTRKANVYYANELAGQLIEDDQGYAFKYASHYLAKKGATAISMTLPLTNQTYRSNIMFPFFDGLIPEGWLLNISVDIWKVDRRDRMGLLLLCCKDCIGAVSVEVIHE